MGGMSYTPPPGPVYFLANMRIQYLINLYLNYKMVYLIVGRNCTDSRFVALMDVMRCKVHNVARLSTAQRNKGMGFEIKRHEKLDIFLSA